MCYANINPLRKLLSIEILSIEYLEQLQVHARGANGQLRYSQLVVV